MRTNPYYDEEIKKGNVERRSDGNYYVTQKGFEESLKNFLGVRGLNKKISQDIESGKLDALVKRKK